MTLRMVSDSAAYDAALRALVDAATVAAGIDNWLIIGGHMVNLHVLRSGVSRPERATRDADLAVEVAALREGAVLGRLRDLGYRPSGGANRFGRPTGGPPSIIDVLVPSYTMRHQPNMAAGPIVADGIPALHVALARPPVAVDLTAELTDKSIVEARLRIPDIASAIAVKTFAYADRFARRDAEDLASLLEVAHADGVTAASWPAQSSFAAAARQLTVFFDRPGRGLTDATTDRAGQVRLRALVRSVVAHQI